jgi:hypothetical protein
LRARAIIDESDQAFYDTKKDHEILHTNFQPLNYFIATLLNFIQFRFLDVFTFAENDE